MSRVLSLNKSLTEHCQQDFKLTNVSGEPFLHNLVLSPHALCDVGGEREPAGDVGRGLGEVGKDEIGVACRAVLSHNVGHGGVCGTLARAQRKRATNSQLLR